MLCLQAHDAQRLLKDACTIAAQAPAEERSNWECVREEMFPVSDQNQYRHLRVADFSDNVSALPPEELQVQSISCDTFNILVVCRVGTCQNSDVKAATHK